MKSRVRQFLLGLVLIGLVAPAPRLFAAPEPPLKWRDSLKVGRALSDEKQKPLVVFFHAAWCGQCRRMKQTTLSDPAVRKALRAFVLVALDVDNEEQSFRATVEFQVRGIPHTVILSPDGRVLSQLRGYVGPSAFKEELARTAKAYATQELADTKRQQALKWLAEEGLTPDRWANILAVLGERRGDPEIQGAIKAHKRFPAGALVTALHHQSLAVRLAAFEILQDVSGEDFSFDPWATDAQRKPLQRWARWARDVKVSGLPKKSFLPLTRERIQVLIGDLVGSDPERRRRARIKLSQSQRPGFKVIRELAAGLNDLKVAERLRIKEVLFSIQVPRQLAHVRLDIAHALVFGDIEGQTATIRRLQSEGGVNALGLLAQLLREDNSLVREGAIEAVRLIGGDNATKLLLSLKDEKDVNVRVTLITNLAQLETQEVMDFLLSHLKGPEEVVVAALKGLRGWKRSGLSSDAGKKIKSALRPLFRDKRWRVRGELLETIKKMDVRGLEDGIIQCLDDEDDFVRKNAMLICGRKKLTGARGKLRKLFESDDSMKPMMVGVMLQIDQSLLDQAVVAGVLKAPKEIILDTLEVLANYENLPPAILLPLMDSKDPDLRQAAFESVAEVGRGYRCKKIEPKILAKVAGFLSPDQPEAVRLEALKVFTRFRWADYMKELERARRQRASERRRSRSRGWLSRLFEPAADEEPALGKPLKQRLALKESVIDQAGSCLKAGGPELRYQAALLLGGVGVLDGIEVLQAKSRQPSTSDGDRIKILGALCDLLKKPSQLRFHDPRVFDTDEEVQARRKELIVAAEDVIDGMFKVKSPRLIGRLTGRVVSLGKAKLSRKILDLLRAKRIDFRTVLQQAERNRHFVYTSGGRRQRKLSTFQTQLLEFARLEIESPDEKLQHFSLVVLGRLGKSPDSKLVRRFLQAKDRYVRRSALIALFRLDPQAGFARAEEMLNDPFWEVARLALKILGAAPTSRLYLRDKLGAGEWLGSASARAFSGKVRTDARSPAGDLVREKGRLKKSVIAAAIQLMQHKHPQVRYEAGKLLLGQAVKVDYTDFAKMLAADENRTFPPSPILTALRDKWPQVPVEFYPFLRKHYLQKGSSSARRLFLRINAKDLKQATQREQQDLAELVLRAEKVPELEPPKRPAAAAPGDSRQAIAYFYQRGCRDCYRVAGYLEQIQKDFPDLEIRKYNILPAESAMFNEILCQRTEVPAQERQVVPAVFSSTQGLVGKRINLEGLLELVLSSENRPAPWEIEEMVDASQLEAATERIKERYAGKDLAWIVGAGLIDGINPCAFTVIIFFLSYLFSVGREKRDLLITGMMFTLGVFVTYLLVGFGLLEAVQALKVMPALTQGIYWTTALFALVVGVLSFRDGILCLKGRIRDVSLQLPSKFKTMIQSVIRHQTRLRTIVIASLCTGFLVSLLELACTGQVYLPAIVFISKGAVRGTFLLVLYNIAFVVPLVLIFVLAYFGLSSEKLTRYFRQHVATIKFMLAGVFFGLFGLLVIFQ